MTTVGDVTERVSAKASVWGTKLRTVLETTATPTTLGAVGAVTLLSAVVYYSKQKGEGSKQSASPPPIPNQLLSIVEDTMPKAEFKISTRFSKETPSTLRLHRLDFKRSVILALSNELLSHIHIQVFRHPLDCCGSS